MSARSEKRKAAKKAYKADLEFNEEIEIAKFVCEELDVFSTTVMQKKVEESEKIYAKGLNGVRNVDATEIEEAIREAKALPATTKEERAKVRSKTFPGFARAMAEQWSQFLQSET